jgi:hypothetical protein
LVIGGKCNESIFGKGRVARKNFIGGKAKHAYITGGISYFTLSLLKVMIMDEFYLKLSECALFNLIKNVSQLLC